MAVRAASSRPRPRPRPPSAPRGAGRRRGGPGLAGWLLRLAAFALLVLAGGFVWYVATLPSPAPLDRRTEGVVVLTGGPGRLARGAAALATGAADRLLVSGVDRQVRAVELQAASGLDARLFACCVDLGFVADSTRTNAAEVADWVERHGIRSVRLVTSDFHARRAHAEVSARLGPGVAIVVDAVPGPRSPQALAREYAKFLAARLIILGERGPA